MTWDKKMTPRHHLEMSSVVQMYIYLKPGVNNNADLS